MWTPLGINSYLLRKERLVGECNFYLSNFIRMWTARLKDAEIVCISKKLNPLIEATSTKMIETVLLLFDKDKGVEKRLEENVNEIKLHLLSHLSGVKFQFELRLKLESPDMLYKEITLPLILLAAKLQIREKKLIDLIEKKEKEINEYREENGFIKRIHLITKDFCLSDLSDAVQEEAVSLFEIKKDPSLIFSLVSADMFESIEDKKQEKNNLITDGESRSNDISDNKSKSLNAVNNKSYEKPEGRHRRVKNKINVQINTAGKKKKEIYNNLKL